MNTQSQKNPAEKNQNPKDLSPRVMFLEYDRWKKGEHTYSAIIKMPGEKRGKVSARIFIEFDGEPKRATYIAKDASGKELFPRMRDLFLLKQEIKKHSRELYEKALLEKNALEKTEESNPNRAEELKQVRKGKEGKSQGIER